MFLHFKSMLQNKTGFTWFRGARHERYSVGSASSAQADAGRSFCF
jgi:hypothetical protein